MENNGKKIENGTEVLIFKYIPQLEYNQDMVHFIRGKIISSNISDGLIVNYVAVGEDGKIYFSNYGNLTSNCSFFMIEEDYIAYLKSKILSNEKIIVNLEDQNRKIKLMIDNVKNKNYIRNEYRDINVDNYKKIIKK